jgi:ribose 5-phosphate isomerase A
MPGLSKSDLELEKQNAARAALDFVKDGQIVGLGSGSTSAYFIQFVGERVRAGLQIRGVPTSVRAQQLAEKCGITLTTLAEVGGLDVAVDGADEFDPQLNLIKGGGGALLREKIVASAARQFIVIADSNKQVPVLGTFPLPVEVIGFAESLLMRKLSRMGANPVLRRSADGTPYKTDEGHHILDCHFGKIPDPPALARTLSDTPGVVEHGLFINIASIVLLAKGNDVVALRR